MKKLMVMLLVMSFSAFAGQKLTRDSNGIVTDPNTGLQWQDIYSKINPNPTKTPKIRVEKTLEKAIKYCEDLTIAGLDDWRLPNYNELFSLVIFTVPDITMSKEFNVTNLKNAATIHNSQITPISNGVASYFSSTTYISKKSPFNNKKYVWAMSFDSSGDFRAQNRLEKNGASGSYGVVRCVRTTNKIYNLHY